MAIHRPIVLGTGGVGSLAAELLLHLGMEVTTLDRSENPKLSKKIRQIEGDAGDTGFLSELFASHDAAVSCLPFFLTRNVAEAAHRTGIPYFDPTEDVATTQLIRDLAESSSAVMIPQCGLAPGFIGILGAYLAAQFDEGSLRHIKMRVGALPLHPIGQLGYAGNWSLEGLINEYIEDCDIIAHGRRQKVPALRNPEILRIEGIEYEAFTTSGGLGTMTETYDGKVETLNYKSIRYPGHLAGMKLLLEELRFREDPRALVERIGYALPPDDQDRVLIHCSVQGKIDGKLRTKEVVTDYKPMEIAGKTRTAIAWTTAASIVAVVEMVHQGALPQRGFVKQEDIPLPAFLQTKTGGYYAEDHPVLANLL